MCWTEPYDPNIALQDDSGMCLALIIEALHQAYMKGVEFDLHPETYVAKFFRGIQPSVSEFLNFLSKKGYDAEALYKKVTDSIHKIRPN